MFLTKQVWNSKKFYHIKDAVKFFFSKSPKTSSGKLISLSILLYINHAGTSSQKFILFNCFFIELFGISY